MAEATGTSDRAKEQVQEKAQVTQETVKEGAATLQSRAREQIDQRSTQAGEQMSSSAQALRSTSERLREEGQDGPARAAERAADQAERLGGYLTEADADRILGDVEDFGRRRPLAVVAIGIAAGFTASRFLKASSSSRYAGRPPQRAALGEGVGSDVQATASPAGSPDER
ncbi:MAG: hypothetical protein WBC33_11665 [Conexibacter sp.]